MAASLIPERTIDAWIAIVVEQGDPAARIWAPTPLAQAGTEPWDHAIGGPGHDGKLLVLESKGLSDDSALVARRPHVTIHVTQLLFLMYLELWESLPAFYALPALTLADLGTAPASGPLWWASQRLAPRNAGQWIRVPSATQLAMHPNVRNSIRLGRASRRIQTSDIAGRPWPGLADFLTRARRCEFGRLVSATSPFPHVPGGLLLPGGVERAVALARQAVIASRGDIQALPGLASESPAIRGLPARTDGRLRLLDRTLWVLLETGGTPGAS